MLAAVIQARMGSSRLPGKTLAEVCGKPLLEHLVDRVLAARSVEGVVIATTTEARDDAIVAFAERRGLPVHRGSEDDVLDRIHGAARRFGVETIVRVTPDCPLMDPRVIDRVVETYRSGACDYASNTLTYTYPDGLDVEVFSFSALERAWKDARLGSEREHVTLYLKTSGAFTLASVEHGENLNHLKWSVDTAEDLAFVRAVFQRLDGPGTVFHFEDVLRLCAEDPTIAALNARSVANEGYYRSLLADPPVPGVVRDLTQSRDFLERAARVIPGLSQTFSKAPSQFVQGVSPGFLRRGAGCHVWDVDGHEYIDYSMGLGPVILGHDYPAVTAAVTRQMREGTIFSLPHPVEVEAAELIVDTVPGAEMVRFGKNGSDATSGAVRLARAFTGREVIACCGYHGWQDWFIGTTTRNRGVPDAVRRLTVPFAYNDLASLERIFAEHPGRVAAVIMEPIGVVEPRDDFLARVRALATREGALLIFDELLTGFRLALGGAEEYFGVAPDLACFGKAIANGYPIAAVTGRRELMELFDEIFFSFTFGGETLSLAAAVATITELRERRVIAHLWGQGRALRDGYNVLARELGIDRFTQCIGLAPRTALAFKDEHGADSLALKSLFLQESVKRGILYGGAQNISYSHENADIDRTLRAYRAALEILARAIESGDPVRWLEGAPVQPVFRRV